MYYGLIKSSVAIALSDFIVEDEGNDNIICEETGDTFPLEWLPDEAEAGDYRYPFDE